MLKLLEDNVNRGEDLLVDRHQRVTQQPTRSAFRLSLVVTPVVSRSPKDHKKRFPQATRLEIELAYFERLIALFQKARTFVSLLTNARQSSGATFLSVNVLRTFTG